MALWAICLSACFQYNTRAYGSENPPVSDMPSEWRVLSDIQVQSDQVKAMSRKLGADIGSVRNTVYDVKGKRVQINVIVTQDMLNAEKLMTTLRSMKSEQALLQKGLIVYEFVGPNDVLSVIAEGREHLK